MILDHKISHKGQFMKIEYIIPSESWIHKLSIETIFENLKSEGAKKNQSMNKKITFKVVQMKFLAMHIIDQKLRFYIFMVGNYGRKLNMIFT